MKILLTCKLTVRIVYKNKGKKNKIFRESNNTLLEQQYL